MLMELDYARLQVLRQATMFLVLVLEFRLQITR